MQSFDRLVRMVQRGYGRIAGSGAPAFAVQLPGADPTVFGRGDPAATVVVNDRRGVTALARMDAISAVGYDYAREALAAWTERPGVKSDGVME